MTNTQHSGRLGLSFLSQDPVASRALPVAAGTLLVRLKSKFDGQVWQQSLPA